MAVRILPLPRLPWFDNNGEPLNGGSVFTYEPGTTTEKPTYKDIGKAVAHANPIVLNARGEPDAAIYFDGEYKIVIKDSAGVQIYEQDNYGDAEPLPPQAGASLLVNGSFEVDQDGDGVPDAWTLVISSGNTVALDTTNEKDGANALKFNTVDGVKAGTATSDLMPFIAAGSMFVKGWTISNAANLTNQVIADWYSDSITLISSGTIYDDAGTSVTSLTEFSQTVTAPANTKYVKIRIEGANGGGVNTGASWFDAISVEQPSSAADAALLDGLDSAQFLRSDVADTAAGKLTLNAGLDVNTALTTLDAGVTVNNVIATANAGLTVNNTKATFNAGLQVADTLSEFFATGGTAADVLHLQDTTDGTDLVIRYNGTNFEIRTATGGLGTKLLEFSTAGLALTAVDWANSDPGTIAQVLTDHNKAAHDALNIDADTLDSLNSTQFLRSDTSDAIDGTLTVGVTFADPRIIVALASTPSAGGWARGVEVNKGAILNFGAGLLGSGSSITYGYVGTGSNPHTQGLRIDPTTGALSENGNQLWHAGNLTFTSQRVELGGDFNAGQEVVCERIGNTVTVTLEDSLTHANSSVPASSAGAIPATYRPTAEVSSVARVFSSSGLSEVKITSAGTLQVNHYNTSFAGISRTDTGRAYTITYVITSTTP